MEKKLSDGKRRPLMMLDQLPLRINLREETTFTNFCVGENRALFQALNELLKGSDGSFIYLWGESGVGRTHLLQACCHAMKEPSFEMMYLPLKTPQLTPLVLQELEKKRLVCIDDIDTVLGSRDWEEALLHFYNRAREFQVKLVMAGDRIPLRLNCELADLMSRLSCGLVFQVVGLSDAEKIAALQIRARDRGFELSDEIGQFLLHRYPRDMTVLFQLLDKLDRASLAAKRKLTIPFVKHVLENS